MAFDLEAFTAWLGVMLKAVGIVEPVLVRPNPGKLDQLRVWIGKKFVLLSGLQFEHFTADHGDDARREFLRQYGAAEVDEQALALEYAYWGARLDAIWDIANRLGLNLWARSPEYDALYATGGLVEGAVFRGPADAAALAKVGFNALVRMVGVRGECSSTPPNRVTPLAREMKEKMAEAQLEPGAITGRHFDEAEVAAAFGHAMFAHPPETPAKEKIWDDEQPPVLFGGSKTDPHDGIEFSLQIGTEPVVVIEPPPVPAKEKCPWIFPWPEPPAWNG